MSIPPFCEGEGNTLSHINGTNNFLPVTRSRQAAGSRKRKGRPEQGLPFLFCRARLGRFFRQAGKAKIAEFHEHAHVEKMHCAEHHHHEADFGAQKFNRLV